MQTLISEIKITVKNLLARKGRSFLTILGIIIGVAGVIIIISLGAGAQSLVLGQITKIGSNLVSVSPGKRNEKGPPASVFGVQIKTLSMRDVNALRDKNNVPNGVAVAPVVNGSGIVVFGKENMDVKFVATEASYAQIQNIEMLKGSFFSEEQGRSGDNVIVLGYNVATELFPEGGEIGRVVKIKVPTKKTSSGKDQDSSSIPVRVIGVQKKMGTVGFVDQDDRVFVPFVLGQKQLLGIDYVQFIGVKVDDSINVKSTMEDVSRTIRQQHRIKDPVDDDFTVRDLADALKILTSITGTLRVFLGLMAGISLVVGGIGIMKIMLVTVSERTREIGLRKAIGATKKNIRNQFLLESIILTLTGGVVGILVGIFISYLIAIGARFAGYDWAFVISLFSVLLAVFVSVFTGIIFGLYPALKAAKLDPIEALRYE